MSDKEIIIDNLKEAIRTLNYGFKFMIGIIIVFTLIVVRGDADLVKNIEVPFINLEAPSLWVAVVSLFLYLMSGLSMLHSYKMINKILVALKGTSPTDFNSMLYHPSLWISGNRTDQCIVILLPVLIFASVLVQTWPTQKWTQTIIVPLAFSIPYFILIIRIWRNNNLVSITEVDKVK